MSAEKIKKTGKRDIETYRPSDWLLPFERMEEMFDNFMPRPFRRSLWQNLPRLTEGFENSPSVDIFDDGKNIVVKSDLPGMTKDDIEINLTDDTITVSGEKKKEETIEKKDYYRMERSSGSFCRSFNLPSHVQTGKAKASFKNGTLEIKIPKTTREHKKGHKINIE